MGNFLCFEVTDQVDTEPSVVTSPPPKVKEEKKPITVKTNDKQNGTAATSLPPPPITTTTPPTTTKSAALPPNPSPARPISVNTQPTSGRSNNNSRANSPEKPGATRRRSGSKIRDSKFRNVFGEPPKLEASFSNLRVSAAPGDGNGIKANHLFTVACLQGGGGSFLVEPVAGYKRFDSVFPIIDGHTAPITDFDFHRFQPTILASCSEDCYIKIWNVPATGLTQTCYTPENILKGHGRKIFTIKFHPSVDNVLASVAADGSAVTWDIETGDQIYSMESIIDNQYHDLVWNYDGSMLVISSKDHNNNITYIDVRSPSVAHSIPNAHDGGKSVKIVSLEDSDNYIISIGTAKGSLRQVKLWDPRNTSIEICRMDLDNSPGVIMPFYDVSTGLLFLAGKGDSNIRVCEIPYEKNEIFQVSEFKSNTPNRGMAYVSKRALNTQKCEVARLLKLTSSSIDPISITVPRASNSFQADLYPDVYGDTPNHTLTDWMNGSNKMPNLISLKPLMTLADSDMSMKRSATASSNTMKEFLASTKK